MNTNLQKAKYLILGLCIYSTLSLSAQDDAHALYIRTIFDHALTESNCYDRLYHLSENIGGRLTGSKNAENAVDWTFLELKKLGVDSVWKQKCMVPHWERRKEASVFLNLQDGPKALNATSLGNSIGTEAKDWTAEIIEVMHLDSLEGLGEAILKDKIVFFNRPMDPKQIHTGWAYGGAVDQRSRGPAMAARFGAKAVLVRSMTTLLDDVPHTGVTVYDEDGRKIPGIAISTLDAEMLSKALKANNKLTATINADCGMVEDKLSHNVVAEIRGTEFPNEIILVGGHLDSWDLAGGAHDDGAGCMHSIQVFETLLVLGYKPKRTLRCVMFMNEENGLAGGKKYAELSNEAEEFHLAAIESDLGGFTPRGFGCSAREDVYKPYLAKFQAFEKFLTPYDLHLKAGGGGADIGPLKSQGGLLIGLRPDPQRYFDLHHTKNDRIDQVNKRELELGAAAMTSLVYLIDQMGLK